MAICILLICALSARAQQSDTTSAPRKIKKFTTTTDQLKDAILKFVFTLDSRQSVINSKPVGIDGIKTGVELNSKMRFGIGVYGLLHPLEVAYKLPGQPDTFLLKMYFTYASLFAEYVIFQNKKWELSAPLQYGIGSSFSEKTHYGNDVRISARQRYSNLAEISINGHYKIVRWAGVGGGIGYRYMFTKIPTFAEAFDAPIYIIKAKLFLGELYRTIFKKD